MPFSHLIAVGKIVLLAQPIVAILLQCKNQLTDPIPNANNATVVSWQTGDFDELHIQFDAIVL